jgi:hypothetical protein
MGWMTPMLDHAAPDPADPGNGGSPVPVGAGEALAALEAAVAHLATCPRCHLDLSCVDGAALGEAAAWLWHRHRDHDDPAVFGDRYTEALNPDADEPGGGGGG